MQNFLKLLTLLVVGAGIIDLASAYHIKRRDPSLNVLFVDKASAFGQGDTAKSNERQEHLHIRDQRDVRKSEVELGL